MDGILSAGHESRRDDRTERNEDEHERGSLIGFAGAPFTLACYAIEGGGSRHYEKAKAFMYRDPGNWHALVERLAGADDVADITARAKDFLAPIRAALDAH